MLPISPQDGLHARLADASLHREAWYVCAVAANASSFRNELRRNDHDSVRSSDSSDGSRINSIDSLKCRSSERVVEAVLHEGLGNQLFQIAFAERLAHALTQHTLAAYNLQSSKTPAATVPKTTSTATTDSEDAIDFNHPHHPERLSRYCVKVVGHPDSALLPRLRELGLLYDFDHSKSKDNQHSLNKPATNTSGLPSIETMGIDPGAGLSAPQRAFARNREGRKAAAEAAERAAWPSHCGNIATLSDIPTYANSARKSGFPPFIAQVTNTRL